MKQYLSRGLACSRCDGICMPEAQSATLKDSDGKVLEYLCPICTDKVEQELVDMDAQEFTTDVVNLLNSRE